MTGRRRLSGSRAARVADAGANVIRAAVAKVGGHATLVRASEIVRNAVDVFEPQPAPIMELTRKLKATFDPGGYPEPGTDVRWHLTNHADQLHARPACRS